MITRLLKIVIIIFIEKFQVSKNIEINLAYLLSGEKT